MMDDLVERLRAYAKDWRDRAASQEVVLEAADALAAQARQIAERDAEIARLREALAKDATRFEVCAGYIDASFNSTGTLRAERTIKAKHFALEALAALENGNG